MKDCKRYFAKMIDYIDKIQNITKDISFENFVMNEEKILACAFSLTQIGEYANKFSEQDRKNFSAIPWKDIRGMRNIIVHEYDNVNANILWDTIEDDLPKLKIQIQSTL